MRYRSTALRLLLCLLAPLSLLCGCASSVPISERSEEWIARPLSELKASMSQPGSYASKAGWKEKTYPLANGNSVFIEPVSKECFLHWEVTPRGIIIGSRAVGSECTDETVAPSGVLKNKITEPSQRW